MCKCNQGGTRVDKIGISMLNEARSHLVLARKRKQAAEMARDYAENGGPKELFGRARVLEIKAQVARRQARQVLVELEIRCNKAYVPSLAGSYISASKLTGWRFHTWADYRKTFGPDAGASQDIWQ